jgi:VWFA-related protein
MKWAVALALAAGLSAQVVFRSAVQRVELDVIVTDKQDRPVKGLTQADFEIVERGRPQVIRNFQAVALSPVRRQIVEVKSTAPTIDIVSNSHPPLGRQWVLVVDDLHIIETHIVHTQRVIKDFLEQLPADDQVAIVFVGRSDLSQDFTSDLGAQMRTVNRIKDALGFAPDASDDLDPRTMLRHATATTDVMNNIIKSLTRSTHPRKAIVHVTEGMTYAFRPPSEVFDRYVELFEAARRAGLPIYTIDPRGLPDCSAYRGPCGNPSSDGRIKNQQQQLRAIAENTGGLAFVNNSDMVRAVRELVEDNNGFYLIAYEPDPYEADGKFHDVKVRIKGRDDLRVRARAGYSAPKPNLTAEETKLSLDDVLGAALPVPGLKLRAFAAPFTQGPKGVNTIVTLEVTYPAGVEGAKLDDDLEFGIVALDRDGKIKNATKRTFRYTASPQAVSEISYTVNDTIDLPIQPLTLRVGIASRALGRAASIHLPVEAPNIARRELQVGAVVIGFNGPPRQTAVPAGALSSILPFQPTTERVFSSTDSLRVGATFFWAFVSREEELTAMVRIADAKGSRSAQTMQLAPQAGMGSRRTSLLDATVSLKGLAPGTYTLQVSGRLGTNASVRREVAFQIK